MPTQLEAFTKENLRVFLRQKWAEYGVELAPDERIGLSIAELVEYSAQRNADIELPHLDFWLEILDELISWQLSLLNLIEFSTARAKRLTDFDKSVMMILAKIIGDSLSFRNLILSGFDISSQVLLRSIYEYMQMLVAVLHDPSFSSAFVQTNTPEAAKSFWQNEFRGKKIERRVRAAWRDIMNEHDNGGTAKELSDWVESLNARLSAVLHPSIAGGMFTAIPFKTKYSDDSWHGAWGDKSDGSSSTIYAYCAFIFPILVLSKDFPFSGFDEWQATPIPFDDGDEFARHVRYGRPLLSKLIWSLVSENNRKKALPEYDYSIWGE